MPDRQKCTRTTAPPYSPPPPPEPPEPPEPPADDGADNLFRHTFLWRLTNPDDREALLRLGTHFNDWMYETGCWGEDSPPWIPSMAGALADDVEALAAYALSIATICTEGGLELGDLTVCCAAGRWAERLAHLAVEIRAATSAARGTA